MLVIATYATENYCYAQHAQAPVVIQSLRYAKIAPTDVAFVFVGDGSKTSTAAFEGHRTRLLLFGLPDARIIRIKLDVACNANASHGKNSNLVIAEMQNEAMDMARCLGADLFWSLESDILPQPNVLQTLIDVLRMDHGYYGVAMATYPNESYLGGYGNPQQWISPTVYPDERDVDKVLEPWLAQRNHRQQRGPSPMNIQEERWAAAIDLIVAETPPEELAPDIACWAAGVMRRRFTASPVTEEEKKWWGALEIALDNCPPTGNVFERNAAKGWRPRGWLEDAHPGVGLGGVLRSFWVGMGCTLIGARALDLANFIGYDGGCTQDLWLCWQAWFPKNINLATVTHAICSHVKSVEVDMTPDEIAELPVPKGSKAKQVTKKRVLKIHHATHEMSGARNGHLNRNTKEWNQM